MGKPSITKRGFSFNLFEFNLEGISPNIILGLKFSVFHYPRMIVLKNFGCESKLIIIDYFLQIYLKSPSPNLFLKYLSFLYISGVQSAPKHLLLFEMI